MALRRLKRIRSYAGHARFLAECAPEPAGTIPRQTDIPSPYQYSPEWNVHAWNSTLVTIRETSHRQYDVFEVPADMLTPAQ